jgi:hypothetical protein
LYDDDRYDHDDGDDSEDDDGYDDGGEEDDDGSRVMTLMVRRKITLSNVCIYV